MQGGGICLEEKADSLGNLALPNYSVVLALIHGGTQENGYELFPCKTVSLDMVHMTKVQRCEVVLRWAGNVSVQ